nr:hypothetical protein KitaXyl93_19320 [Kitasatospora sp. Xyl93]
MTVAGVASMVMLDLVCSAMEWPSASSLCLPVRPERARPGPPGAGYRDGDRLGGAGRARRAAAGGRATAPSRDQASGRFTAPSRRGAPVP